MNFKFDILFEVQFRHQYLENDLFHGITVVPEEETTLKMKRLGMVYKTQPGGFLIGYDSSFASQPRNRQELLKEVFTLSFRLNLVDLGLYNYTEHLPQHISGSIFHFTNYSIPGGEVIQGSLLHRDDYVSEKELDDRKEIKELYFSKPFGRISILLHPNLEKSFTIHFAAKATYWQYILQSEHLMNLQKPAIINKATKKIFLGPVPVKLSENKQGLAFVSEEPIVLTKMPNRKFHLVENYESGNERYKIIMAVLPNPDINQISALFGDELNNSKKIFSNIIL